MQTKRGPYAKSRRRKDQILQAALAAYAGPDGRTVSIRDIAEAVGMTDAGVLHHFGNRDNLLTAVISERDRAENDARDLEEIIRHNIETPGLVKLFMDLSAAAAETSHPAHAYFVERTDRYRDSVASHYEERAATSDEAQWAARMMLAAVDGIQLQWLRDPRIDMTSDLVRLRNALERSIGMSDASPSEEATRPRGV